MVWTAVTTVPPVNLEGSTCALGADGKVYVVSNDVSGVVWVYDTALDTWTGPKAAVLPPAYYGWAGEFLGRIYMIPLTGNQFGYYDPIGDTWTDLSAGLPDGGNAAPFSGACTDGSKIYVPWVSASYGTTGFPGVAIYDPGANTWDIVTIPVLDNIVAPHGADQGLIQVIGNVIYFVQGISFTIDPGPSSLGGWNYAYDMTAHTGWVQKTPSPVPAYVPAYAANVLGDVVWVGGQLDNADTGSTFTVFYDPTTDAWDSYDAIPIMQQGGILVAVGDRLYLIGGFDGFGLTSANVAWAPLADFAPPVLDPPEPQTTVFAVLTPVIATPGFVTVNVSNLTAGELVSFRLDADDPVREFDTAVMDENGQLVNHMLLIDTQLVDGSHHTIYAHGSLGTASDTFTADNSLNEEGTVPPPVPPTLIVRTGVQRWYFQDPTGQTPDHYIFPRNPDPQNPPSTPYADKQLSYDFTANPVTGQPISNEGSTKPAQWSFSGTLLSLDEENAFVYWLTRPYRVYLVDDENRAYTVYLTGFDVKRAQTLSHMGRRKYTMKCTVYDITQLT